MASKKMVLTDKGVARYRTRMMQAGDEVTMAGREAKYWAKLGWATEAPVKRAKPAKVEPVIPTVEEVLSAEVVEDSKPELVPVEESPVTVEVAEPKAVQRKPRAKAKK